MFTEQDDEELRNLVNTFGESSWKDIAIRMPLGFSSRQCRERWQNYVSPLLYSQIWTDEEDQKLIEEFARVGTRWTVIAEAFPGRSGNTVRNRYFLLQRKKDKQRNRAPPPPPAIPQGPNPPQPERADASTGTSWLSPDNFVDLGQDLFLSIFFPLS
jgi:hypothetical protein